MDVTKILFDAMAVLTKGYITDVATLLMGLLFIGFLLMAFDKLRDALDCSADAIRHRRIDKDAEEYLEMRNSTTKGTHAWNEANMTYRRLLKRSVELKMKNY